MKTQIQTTEPGLEYAGEFITENFYLELVENFGSKFPSEVRSVNISRQAIETVLNDGNVSGIKFMNGLENADDPGSRMLILIPANYTAPDSLPNSIFKAAGFMTNNGDIISLERTWEVLFNHVLNYKQLDPAMHYTKINRGSFFGKALLKEFLDATGCDNFIFHFGYLVEENLPYKPIIQPADGMKMFIEMSMPCPGSPGCPKDNGKHTCALTQLTVNFAGNEGENQLAVLRSFRDRLLQDKMSGAEIEKYYTISASLVEAIDNHKDKDAIFKNLYEKYLKPSVEHLNRNDEASAYKLFIEVIDHISNAYLFQ